MKNLKYLKFVVPILVMLFLHNYTVADEITSAEVNPTPSVLSADSFNQSVYLQGINTQLFSSSSKKEPEVEAAQGLTVNSFMVLSPKLALLNVNVSNTAFGSIQVNLKFYDLEGVNVIKTCVFYIDVLGPKIEEEYTIQLTSLPDIFIDIASAQIAGSFEITGPLKGSVEITPPTGTKFFSGIEPSVTALTMNADVTNVEVNQAGSSLTFFVQNSATEVVKIFVTSLFLDASEFTRNSGVRGQLNIEIKSGSVSNPLSVPIANTAGYTSTVDETVEENSQGSNTSNNSDSSTRSSYNSYNSSNKSESDDSSNKSTTQKSNSKKYNKDNQPYFIQGKSEYRGSYGRSTRMSYSGSYGNRRSQPHYNSNNSRESRKGNTPQTNKAREDDDSEESEGLSWPKFAKVNPAVKSRNKIANVVFCNSKFIPLKAIPLEVSKSGFIVKFSLEIELINSDNTKLDKFVVNINLPGIDAIKMTLTKVKNNVYRSEESIKAIIPFDQFN